MSDNTRLNELCELPGALDVLKAVQEELLDPRFNDKDHHDIRTYNRGCRGPLCKKASRDYQRDRYRKDADVPETEFHKPTKITMWDELLGLMPVRFRRPEVAA